MNKTKGRLWIVAAPSGGGKTSLVEAAIAKVDDIVRSVSFTTREKRVGEIDGNDYVFVDKTEFERLIVEKKMLEYETVFDNYYGTSLDFINRHLDNGKDVVLTIDWPTYAKQFRTAKVFLFCLLASMLWKNACAIAGKIMTILSIAVWQKQSLKLRTMMNLTI